MSDPASPTPALPPSEPRSSSSAMRASSPSAPSSRAEIAESLLGGAERPARLQMVAALVLGLLLVAIPLYLWRRPRAEAVAVTNEAADAAVANAVPTSAPPATPAAPGVTLSEARVLECHDTGRGTTAPADCDHLAPVETALAKAIQSNDTCLPTSAGGGSLVYVLDVSFLRKRSPWHLTVPKDGRALTGLRASGAEAAHAAAACGAGVKRALSGLTLDGVPHAHARYKLAITAAYAAPGSATAPAASKLSNK